MYSQSDELEADNKGAPGALPPLVVVTEKMSMSASIAPAVAAHWPGRDRFVVHTCSFGAVRFVQAQAEGGMPPLSEPVFETTPGHAWKVRRINDDGALSSCGVLPAEALLAKGDLVFACDPDSRGAVTFATVSALFGRTDTSGFPAIVLGAYGQAHVTKAVSAGQKFGELSTMVEFGGNKRYFEWNWNRRARAVFGPVLCELGVAEGHDIPLSKFALQTLYRIRESASSLSVGGILSVMESWKGSDNEQEPSEAFGSASSRHEIIAGLHSAGLIATDVNGHVSCTASGLILLDRLHPAGCDVDIAHKLERWCSLNPAAAREEMNVYLDEFFDTQRRHLADEGPAMSM